MNASLFDYAVIVAATAGTIVYLFLMVLIVGYRRRRTFERVLFFLALAMFCVCAGTLLGMNADLYYGEQPHGLADGVAILLIVFPVFLVPGLLVHAHAQYWLELRPNQHTRTARALIAAGYGQLALALAIGWNLGKYSHIRFAQSELIWISTAAFAWLIAFLLTTLLCVALQLRFAALARRRRGSSEAGYHAFLAISFALLAIALLSAARATAGLGGSGWLVVELLAIGILPGLVVAYGIVRRGLLGIGAQKNLVYGVTAGFLAILYLALVRRVSGWMEPYLPPEATSAVLIFVLIGFFEPLQRVANRVLRRNVEQQLERLQRMTNQLQREARSGDLPQLRASAERRLRDEFGLEVVRLRLKSTTSGVETPEGGRLDIVAKAPTPEKSGDAVALSHRLGAPKNDWDQSEKDQKDELHRPGWAGQPVRFQLGKKGAEIGELIAVPIGSSISGETHAALEFLAEQLPGIIELCRAVEEKSRLERELAERERLALVGQMTASISHNLKNPLGSMKTVLQVQLENPQLDTNVRRDLQMVLSELDRLSAKLNALLRYARPAVRGGEAAKQIEVARVADEVAALMKSEAERRDVSLQIQRPSSCGCINGSEDALNDIFSNLIVNAIEAVEAGGRVVVRLGGDSDHVEIAITDDGPGIPAGQQERLFQPFFTTKTSGTGLGLAIVRRRAAELGGSVDCRSPIAGGRGAEFIVRLPRMKC